MGGGFESRSPGKGGASSNSASTATPGKTSGVTARDVVAAPSPDGVTPGKQNLIQTPMVGEQWIDHGAACDSKDDSTIGCFLEDAQRLRLIIEFKSRVTNAQTNYKLALEELRVDKLMQKDDDLNWVISLALDVVGAHFLSVTLTALKGARTSGLKKLEAMALDGARRGTHDEEAWTLKAESMLHKVTDNSIQSYTTTGFTSAKKVGIKGIQSSINKEQKTEKAATISYIDQLKDQCDSSFMQFSQHATSSALDSELVVLYDGMHPDNHHISAYKAALGAKIDRFNKSGVNAIGRTQTHDRFTGDADVLRDTRVLWVRDVDGKNKTLWYQSQEGDFDPNVVQDTGKGAFGPDDPREMPQLERIVPDEFQEAALAKSEQRWGTTPTIQNPYVTMMRKRGAKIDQPDEPENPFAVSMGISQLPRIDLGKPKPLAPAQPIAAAPAPIVATPAPIIATPAPIIAVAPTPTTKSTP